MTTYTFNPNSSSQSYNWSDAATWLGGSVPNGADADVVLPTITDLGTGKPYFSSVGINSGESYSVRSITVSNNGIYDAGSLAVSGAVDLSIGSNLGVAGNASFKSASMTIAASASFSFDRNASATVNSLQNHGTIYGNLDSRLTGTGTAFNGGTIQGYYQYVTPDRGFTIDYSNFINNGVIQYYTTISTAHGTFTNYGSLLYSVFVDAANGGFTNFSGGTLTGGTYKDTFLNVGGAVVTDAATIVDFVSSYDAASGTYVSSQTTLRSVADAGTLFITDRYTTSTLNVAGTVFMSGGQSAIFTADQLTVTASGRFSGYGEIDAPVANDGVITAVASYGDTGNLHGGYVINGAVTGSGTIAIGQAANGDSDSGTHLELSGAASNAIAFADRFGTLILHQPDSFSGTIAPAGYGDTMELDGIALASITGYSYAGTTSGGTLTLLEGATSLSFRFLGNFTTDNFVLSPGPRGLSNSPGSLLIREAQVQYGSVLYVDGSVALQKLVGTEPFNYVVLSGAAGKGQVIVDLVNGYVTKGTQLDANLQNIQGVVLGYEASDQSSSVIGLSTGTIIVFDGQGSDTFYGNGATDYIVGSTGDALIIGSTGNENFYSFEGTNVMFGGTATNLLVGGNSLANDTFYGGGGSDYVYGEGGTVTLIGSTGTERLFGGSGRNILSGSQAPAAVGSTNVLVGGTGTDVLYAGIGVNVLYEGSGADVLVGSTGTDYVNGGSGSSHVYGGSGTDVITTGSGNQYVQAGMGQTSFIDTAANLTAGRFDWIDNFSGGKGTDLYMPTAVQGATSFVSQNGGTAVLTAIGGGQAEIFVSNTDVSTVQAHTHFTV